MTDRALQELLDRQAITDVLYRYTEGIDRLDNTLLAELFEPDAELDYGMFRGTLPELLELRSKPGEAVATHHLVGNVRIAFDGPDRARTVCYLSAVHRALREGQMRDEMVRGRYLDRLVRRDGRWRIASRRLVYDWSRVMPAGQQWWDMLGLEVDTGVRGPGDPAQGFLDPA